MPLGNLPAERSAWANQISWPDGFGTFRGSSLDIPQFCLVEQEVSSSSSAQIPAPLDFPEPRRPARPVSLAALYCPSCPPCRSLICFLLVYFFSSPGPQPPLHRPVLASFRHTACPHTCQPKAGWLYSLRQAVRRQKAVPRLFLRLGAVLEQRNSPIQSLIVGGELKLWRIFPKGWKRSWGLSSDGLLNWPVQSTATDNTLRGPSAFRVSRWRGPSAERIASQLVEPFELGDDDMGGAERTARSPPARPPRAAVSVCVSKVRSSVWHRDRAG